MFKRRVDRELINDLGPNLNNPITIRCCDNYYSYSSGAMLKVVSAIDAQDQFWAFDESKNPARCPTLVEKFCANRLSHYIYEDNNLKTKIFRNVIKKDGTVLMLNEEEINQVAKQAESFTVLPWKIILAVDEKNNFILDTTPFLDLKN